MTLQVEDLRKTYRSRRQQTVAADGVSFDGDAGMVLGILGPNGSGKTTTIKSILGLIKRDSGSVLLDGYDPERHPREVLERSGAVLEGARNIYWRLTVAENMRYYAGIRGLSGRAVSTRIDELLDMLGLQDRRSSRVGTLSRGYQQRCAIGCALVHDPRVVFLDEPTLGLDVESRAATRAAVRRWAADGRLVVVTSHDMAFVERSCDRALVIRDGRIIADGSVASLRDSLVTHTLALSFSAGFEPSSLSALTARGAHRDNDGQGETILVPLDHPGQAYEILGELGSDRDALVNVSVRDNDFETAFMRLLQGHSGDGEAS